MRVAFDHRIFSYERYGGISRYITRLAAGLRGLRNEVRAFAPLHCNGYLPELDASLFQGHRIERYPAKTRRLFLAFNYLRTKPLIRQWRPDVVHETYYGAFGVAPRRCPTVLTVHDMIHELFPQDFPMWDNVRRLKRIAIDRADHIICVSENTRLDLMRVLGVPSDRISVVLHGIDVEDSSSDTASPAPSDPYLLYVGNRRGYKNFSNFLRAVSASSRLANDMSVVAFGGGEFTKSELTLMHELPLGTGRIRQVTGGDEVLQRYYRNATAMVYPSLYEGFGLPPLEAMANGCPVISSNASSMPEVLGEAAEFFDPTSFDDMAAAIERVVYSADRASCLRDRGRGRAGLFSWRHCAEQTLAVYRSVAHW